MLYVAHQSADEELTNEPLIREQLAAESGAAFDALDVRGIGESRPDTCGADRFARPYGSGFFYAAYSIMLDRPYVGQKTFDVLRGLDWLASFGQREIHLAANFSTTTGTTSCQTVPGACVILRISWDQARDHGTRRRTRPGSQVRVQLCIASCISCVPR